jgi:hypothetical protein
MMADIARKALVQVEHVTRVLVERRMPPERAQLRCRSRTPEGAPRRSITTVLRKLSLRSRGTQNRSWPDRTAERAFKGRQWSSTGLWRPRGYTRAPGSRVTSVLRAKPPPYPASAAAAPADGA